MFRMLGKKVELIRYKVTWQEDGQEMQERGNDYHHTTDTSVVTLTLEQLSN